MSQQSEVYVEAEIRFGPDGKHVEVQSAKGSTLAESQNISMIHAVQRAAWLAYVWGEPATVEIEGRPPIVVTVTEGEPNS